MTYGPDVIAISADGEHPSWCITRHPVSYRVSETGFMYRISVNGRHAIDEQKSERFALHRLAQILEELK